MFSVLGFTMYEVITFGSATRDLFLFSKQYVSLRHKEFPLGEGLCVGAGSKIYLDDIIFATGGGGTNAAATFAAQNLKVAYAGKVGLDAGGQNIVEELRELGVETRLVAKAEKDKTAYSVILSKPGAERTILVYQGACHRLRQSEIPWHDLKANWFYVAPLSGESAHIFSDIIDFAQKNKIAVALNPGNSQLSLGERGVKKLFSNLEVLILNQEEGAKITGIDFHRDEKILKTLKSWVSGKVVLTKGPAGVLAADDDYVYKAGIPRSTILERTGAGDAFGSGLVSKLIKGADFEEAIQYGTANATACVQEIGAKNGILKNGHWGKWDKVRVLKYKL